MTNDKIWTLINCGVVMVMLGWGIAMIACAFENNTLFFIGASIWGIGLTTEIIALIMAITQFKRKRRNEKG